MKIVILKALYLIRVSSIRIFWLLFKILPFKKLVEIKNAPRGLQMSLKVNKYLDSEFRF